MATINTEDFYTTDQAVKKIGNITLATLRQYCLNADKGKTPAIKAMRFGRMYLIPKTEITRYKKERREPGRPKSED